MLTQAQRLAWVDRLERKELYHDASKGLIGAKHPLLLPTHFYKACVRAQSLSCIQLFVTPWTVACHEIIQARIPFPRGSFRPRNQTQVSCITGRFFIIWAIREVLTGENLMQLYPLKLWTEKSGRLQSTESQRVGRDWATKQQQQSSPSHVSHCFPTQGTL